MRQFRCLGPIERLPGGAVFLALILRALAAHTSFTEGGNVRAWLFTILRNAYFGASGFFYEGATQITGVAIGAIKSRLNQLANMLAIGGAEDIGPGALELSSIQTLTHA